MTLMDATGDVIVTLSCYFQDVAAAILITGIAVLRVLERKYPASGGGEIEISYARLCLGEARILRYSIYLIVVTGVFEAIYFAVRGVPRFTDPDYAAATAIYVVILIVSAAAFFSSSRLLKKVRALRSRHNING